jgi:V-type H+-transporting ATPase subunit H
MDLSAHNEHLSLQTKEIKEKTIPWEGYQRASLITEQELEMLRLYDRGSDLESDQYVLLFVHLLGKLTRVDTLQNILVLLDDYLSDASMERLTKFSELSNSGFLKLLQKEDEYIQLKSAKILAFIVKYERANVAMTFRLILILRNTLHGSYQSLNLTTRMS